MLTKHTKKNPFRWKQKGAELSLQPNTCKLVFGAQRRNKILGTLAHTFTYICLGSSSKSLQCCQSHSTGSGSCKGLAQPEPCCGRQPDYTLSFLGLVFAFTFNADPYLTDSPSYPTYPPAMGGYLAQDF